MGINVLLNGKQGVRHERSVREALGFPNSRRRPQCDKHRLAVGSVKPPYILRTPTGNTAAVSLRTPARCWPRTH